MKLSEIGVNDPVLGAVEIGVMPFAEDRKEMSLPDSLAILFDLSPVLAQVDTVLDQIPQKISQIHELILANLERILREAEILGYSRHVAQKISQVSSYGETNKSFWARPLPAGTEFKRIEIDLKNPAEARMAA